MEAAVDLRRLYPRTGRRRGEFLICRLTGSGRVCEVTNGRFVEAKLEKSALSIGQLWRSPTGRNESMAVRDQLG